MSEKIGAYLKRFRIKQGLSLTHVAQVAEVSRQYLHEIEGGSRVPSPSFLRKLANTFNVSVIGMMIMAGHVSEDEVMQAARDEIDRLRDTLKTLEDHVEGQGLIIIQEALKS